MEENRVIVKGTTCDPVRIAARVRHKLGKGIAIILPILKKNPEKKAETNLSVMFDKATKGYGDGLEDVSALQEMLQGRQALYFKNGRQKTKKKRSLLVALTSSLELRLYVLGVQSVKPDMNASTVTVKGTVDPKYLIAFIKNKIRKSVEVVIPKKQKDQNKNQNYGEEKDNEKKDGRTIGLSYPNDP
nr:hypothetical protein [Tanacetum cinerariifolium]